MRIIYFNLLRTITLSTIPEYYLLSIRTYRQSGAENIILWDGKYDIFQKKTAHEIEKCLMCRGGPPPGAPNKIHQWTTSLIKVLSRCSTE